MGAVSQDQLPWHDILGRLRRLLTCLLLGALCGVFGGYVGLRVAGTSTQHTAAGDARITVLPSTHHQLLVNVSDPTAQLIFRPWSTSLKVTVDVLRTDDTLLAQGAFDLPGARTQLIADARTAVQNALMRSGAAALGGALAAGLLVGLLLAVALRSPNPLIGIASFAVVVCAALLLVAGLQTRGTVDRDAFSHPTCPVIPNVSVARALRGGTASQATLRAIALRAVCTPGFAEQLRGLRSQADRVLG